MSTNSSVLVKVNDRLDKNEAKTNNLPLNLLTNRDLRRVCFLLKDVLTSEVKSDVDLFLQLKQTCCVKHGDEHRVIEWLLGIVNRKDFEVNAFDCCKECPIDQKLFVSPYRQLLVHLDVKLKDDNLKDMKFLLAHVIPDGTRESVTTALEFFETLEHHGKLSAEDVSELNMLLENIPRKDLMEMLNRFDSVRSKPKVPQSYGLRNLPADYVHREDDVKEVIKLLNSGKTSVGVVDAKKNRPSTGIRGRDVVGIKGMGGIGKTVLAQAVCWQIKKQRQVVWLTVGQTPDILSLLNTLANVWEGQPVALSDVASAQNWIRSKSSEFDTLVVLDDVWDVNHANAFDVLEGSCQLLITTRVSDVVIGLRGSHLHRLGLLEKKQARELLLKCAQKDLGSLSEDVYVIVENILDECDGLPLALVLVGSSLVDASLDSVSDWQDRLEGLQEADLEEIRSCFPMESYPYTNLLAAIEVSFRALPSADPGERYNYREKFLDFAVFPEDSEIPSYVLEMLWDIPGRKARSILEFLERRSLIQNGTKKNCYIVHDVLLDYIRGRLKLEKSDELALEKAHHLLLEKYRRKCDHGKWSNGPRDDKYFFRNLAFHLIGAAKEEELEEELLDFAWLEVKLEVTDLASLLADFGHLNESTKAKDEIRLLKSTLLLSSNVVSSYKNQLGGQLLGRLKGYTENTRIKALLAQVNEKRNENTTAILPSRWCLTPPGGPLMRTTNGRSRTILAIIVTPDMKRIITGGADGTIRFWDYETGKELDNIAAHKLMVYALSLSFKTKFLVSGSFDNTVKVWDTDSLQEVSTLTGHSDWVSGVLITSSSRKILSSSYDGTIILWDLKQALHTFTGHEGNVRGIAITPDERRLASASQDKTVKIWNLENYKLERTLRGHSNTVYAVYISPNGKYVVSGSEDTMVKIWDIDEGIEIRSLIGHTSDIFTVCVTPDGKNVISAGDDKTVKVWSFDTGEELATLRGHSESIRVATVTPNAAAIVSGSEDRTYKIWNLSSVQDVPAFIGHKQGINSLDVSEDGRLCVTASQDSLVKVWDCEGFQEVCALSGHEGGVLAIALHPRFPFAVSGGNDCTIRIWSLESYSEKSCLRGHQHPVQVVSFNEEGSAFVTGGRDNTIGVWDWGSNSVHAWLKVPIFDITHITMNSHCLLVGNRQHAVWKYDVDKEKAEKIMKFRDFDLLKMVKERKQCVEESGSSVGDTLQGTKSESPNGCVPSSCSLFTSSVSIGPDTRSHPALLIREGTRLLLGSVMSAMPLRFLDVDTGMDSGFQIDKNGKSLVTALATRNDEKEVLVGTDQGNIVRIELDSNEIVQTFERKQVLGFSRNAPVTGLATSEDGKSFLTGNSDGELLHWDVETVEAKLLKSCMLRINCVCILKGDCFVAGDENGYLHVVSKEGPNLSTLAHDSPVTAIASSGIPSGNTTRYLATAALETLKIWSVSQHGCDLTFDRQINCPSLNIRTLHFLPTCASLLTGSDDNVVRLWDVKHGNILKKFEAQSFGINYVSTNNDRLIACFDDCSAVTWSLETTNLKGRIQGHHGRYHVIKTLPQSNQAITDGFHYTLNRWSTEQGTSWCELPEPLAVYQHSNEVTALAVTCDGRLLVTGTRDKMLKLWMIDSGECLSEFYFEHSAQVITCSAEGRVFVGLSDGQLCFMKIQSEK